MIALIAAKLWLCSGVCKVPCGVVENALVGDIKYEASMVHPVHFLSRYLCESLHLCLITICGSEKMAQPDIPTITAM